MAQILSSLKAINAYPIPQSFIETTAASRGLDLDTEVTQDALKSKEYRLVTADVYMWLSEAPNISQGGQNYSFDNEQRLKLRNKAFALYAECEDINESKTTYGYKGNRL